MEFQLTPNQQRIFDAVESTDSNILVFGKPGVGKSVLIRALVENGQKKYTLAAPTGLAALNIGGRTLHSIFRLPVSQGIIERTFNNFPIDNNIKYNINHLIIDEVSMVRADTFDYIDRLMRHAKGVDLPFGGAQVICVGDFFQLPPVVVREENVQLRNAGYISPFMFDSLASKDFTILQLNEVLRQKGDNSFMELLDSARFGQVSMEHIRLLNATVSKPTDIRITLTSTNKQADEINSSKLNELGNEIKFFNAIKYGEWPAYPAEENLRLSVGAQVMVKMNKADRPDGHKGEFVSKVVNGTLGVVSEIDDSRVKIVLDNGEEVWIFRKRWERKIKEKSTDDKWVERVVASYDQIPLALAWAISIHKSQGQTFEKAHIDASRIFAPGQLYVALSRVKSLAGVSLNSKVSQQKFFADPNVVRFTKTL